MKKEENIKNNLIKKVFTGTKEYFIYDSVDKKTGKRKRLYARTEEELFLKIKQNEKLQIAFVNQYTPTTGSLREYIKYYLKSIIGTKSNKGLRRLILLTNRVIPNSMMDKHISDITIDEINSFYTDLIEQFSLKNILDIDNILRESFKLASKRNIEVIDFNEIPIPKQNKQETYFSYILSPTEYKDLLDFCLKDDCKTYGKNELIIIFCLLTGLKFSLIRNISIYDIDLENKQIFVNKNLIPLEANLFPISDACVNWLQKQIDIKRINISSFIPMESREKCSCDKIPVFTNSNHTFPTQQSIQSTLSSITQRCSLRRGITSKSLCKSYILYSLRQGVSEEELQELFKEKNKKFIINIQDEYNVQSFLN